MSQPQDKVLVYLCLRKSLNIETSHLIYSR